MSKDYRTRCSTTFIASHAGWECHFISIFACFATFCSTVQVLFNFIHYLLNLLGAGALVNLN